MQKTSTQNHIIQSIYHELDECQDFKLKKEIIENPSLAEEYRTLRKSVSLLNSCEHSPKMSTIKAILRESKNKETEMA